MPRPKSPGRTNYLYRKQRTHCDCGNELKNLQAWFCSKECRDRYNNSDHKKAQKGYLSEPQTEEEAEQFHKDIEIGKKIILSQDEKVVQSLTPPDDLPETERKFREAICPHPYYNGSYSDKTPIKVVKNRKTTN